MDWSQIEDDVKLRTQRALISVSEYKCSRENDDRNSTSNLHLDSRATENDASSNYSLKRNKRASHGIHDVKLTPLENSLQELRNMTILQGKKVLSIENILSAYSGVFESSTESQSSLIMRIDCIERNYRGTDKFMLDSTREHSALMIHVKSLAGKVASLEDTLQISNRSYATKEAFSQLLDSTVEEIKGVGVVVSQSSIRSSQSLSLTEALIQAIHRMRGHLDVFGGDDADSSSPLSLEFLSSLTGERQREQVVRLLTGSLMTSVSSVARDVVAKEAESICSSVNGMLKSLSVQLLQSVDEVGKQNRSSCQSANEKASQCLAVAVRLDSQQAGMKSSLREHAERARDHTAQQIGEVMESVGEALEDFASTQRAVKGDLDSFDSELSEQRKALYLELGLIKDAQTALKNTCSVLEKNCVTESSTMDKRFLDLDMEVRSLKAIVKAENEGSVERSTTSEFSKEVITALVTEVILADTAELRRKEAAEAAQAISSKRSSEVAALGEQSEMRIAAQLQGLKTHFAAEMAQMSCRLSQKETELLEIVKRSAADSEGWRAMMDSRILELHAQAAAQAANHERIVEKLQAAMDRKTSDLASAMEVIRSTHEKSVLSSAQSLAKIRENPSAEALTELQKEVKRLDEKLETVQKAVAEVSAVAVHMGGEVSSTRSYTKECNNTISELAVTVKRLDAAARAPLAHDESKSFPPEKVREHLKKLEDSISSVAASGLAYKHEGDKNIEKRALTITNQLTKLSGVVDVLQSSFHQAEQRCTAAMQKSTSGIERIEALHSDVEVRLNELRRTVDQQAVHSAALLKTVRVPPDEDKVLIGATPSAVMSSNGALLGSPSSSMKKPESVLPVPDIIPLTTAATPSSELIASALSASAPGLLLRLSSAHTQEAPPLLGTISYGSSITNSFTSTRQCSASSLKISIGLEENDEEECQAPGALYKESDMPLVVGSDDSDSDDESGEGENSFDGSDLAVSPSKIAATSNQSPFGNAVMRKFHRGDIAASSAKGKTTHSANRVISKPGSLSNDDDEFNAVKLSDSVVKSNKGADKGSLPVSGTASALTHTANKSRVPLSGAALEDSDEDDGSSSGEDDEDDDDGDDDDFSEYNSMSDDQNAPVGKVLDRQSNIAVIASQSFVRLRSDDVTDPPTPLDTSASSPALALGKGGTHPLVHFDPLDPTGICSPRRSTLTPLSPLRSTLMPLGTSPVIPPVKAGLLSSYNASDNDKLRTDIMSLNHGSLPLVTAPIASPRISSLLPTPAVPATGPIPVSSPALRPSQSLVSGSLLSTGRRAMDSSGVSVSPASGHIPPTLGAGAAVQPIASIYRSNSGPGNAATTHTQRQVDEKEKDDENSILDFDASSWDEEDEAEESV